MLPIYPEVNIMTELLYMDNILDCYIVDFEAEVVSVDADNNVVVLDKTAFYPTGGGQPNDVGSLKWKDVCCKVFDVKKKNKVLHIVEGPIPSVGQNVIGEIDWKLRYDHMRMHTAQHLLSAVIWDKYRASTVGNQIHADYSHIDFQAADLHMEELKEIEKTLNVLIAVGEPVTIESFSRNKIEEELGKERIDLSMLPRSIKELRTVLIGKKGSIDICPCAGTHVKNISELKGIDIFKRKSKGKGKVRVQYKLL